jgi:hypothetical protein
VSHPDLQPSPTWYDEYERDAAMGDPASAERTRFPHEATRGPKCQLVLGDGTVLDFSDDAPVTSPLNHIERRSPAEERAARARFEEFLDDLFADHRGHA